MTSGRRILFSTLLLVLVLPPVQSASQTSAWLDVPFFQQTRKLCGPACIAMILAYWSRHTETNLPALRNPPSFQAISNALATSGSNGVSGKEIARYFREVGFQTFTFQGAWKDVENHLLQGRPLLVALGSAEGNNSHYVVLVGWDLHQGIVLVNDPARRKLSKISRSDFETAWQRTGFWTLLSLPKTGSLNVSETNR